jgi:hypothetical protein
MIELIIILILVLLIVFIVRRVRKARGKQRDSKPPVPAIEVGGELPTFNVIALGGQETGKTVLLASMYHRLTTEIRDGGFRLQTSLDQSVHLTGLYTKLSDPGDEWPAGTTVGETRSFTFECLGSAGGAEYPVLRFNYLDYAGELVGGGRAARAALAQREERQRDLEERIEAAHALFGIIDGQRMLDHINGKREGHVYVETSIIPMIGVMRGAKCPVHFILTKWDLFDSVTKNNEPADENDRLGIVRDELMAQPAIRNMVEQRRRDKRVVRLIPVSAIGRQFATLDLEGHMVKRHNGRLRPVNVELPLCAVLPDLFAQIQDQLDEEDESTIARERRDRAKLSAKESVSAVGKFLAGPVGIAVRLAADLAIGRTAFSDRIADMFVDWVGRPFDNKMGRVQVAVDVAQGQLEELRLARHAVLKEFTERMIVLKHQMPASDLAEGGRW